MADSSLGFEENPFLFMKLVGPIQLVFERSTVSFPFCIAKPINYLSFCGYSGYNFFVATLGIIFLFLADSSLGFGKRIPFSSQKYGGHIQHDLKGHPWLHRKSISLLEISWTYPTFFERSTVSFPPLTFVATQYILFF